ncbi:MAG: orotate phosphoribosyltransferase [Kiritimatiellae bacterium]|nr:orotate phosphoribosyltransferase [Kiritimatiellia bacterium]
MDSDEILSLLRETGALLDGHFELRSGLHSDTFFQCAKVLRFPRIAERLCTALAGKMRAGLAGGAPINGVIAPALGGILVGYELARCLGVRSIFAEKEDGALVLRRGFAIARGEHFVVAEDVITRGGRVAETVEIVRRNGGEVVAVAVLVNRSGGKAVFSCPTFSLLEWEPKTYDRAQCPLCAKGLVFEHPGS